MHETYLNRRKNCYKNSIHFRASVINKTKDQAVLITDKPAEQTKEATVYCTVSEKFEIGHLRLLVNLADLPTV